MVRGNEALINIQALNYPLTIELGNSEEYNNDRYQLTELINGKGNSVHELNPGTPITISNVQVKAIRLEKSALIPREFIVYQNFPNPFNPTTEIKYGIPKDSKVEITIYNALGQKVRSLYSGDQKAGYHTVTWDSRNESGVRLSSGIYFYRVSAGKHQSIKKMILLK